LLLGVIVPDNQNVVRDRTVAGHVALRGCRTAVARHQTLRATLDWSYETLRRAERTALCKLAVFTTTFDTQAACALMVDEEIKATDVPERLTDLAEQSLLTVCWAGEHVLYRLRQPDDALPEENGIDGWTAAARKPLVVVPSASTTGVLPTGPFSTLNTRCRFVP
jgi:hypothetical protein